MVTGDGGQVSKKRERQLAFELPTHFMPTMWSSHRVAGGNSVRGEMSLAWLAAIGSVTFSKRVPPTRSSAVLANENNRWVFHQMHFQWDDKDANRGDLLRPRTYLRLLAF